LDWITHSNENVNVKAQQRTTKATHRNTMDTDTTYLENEVKLHLLDEEQDG
jgi:hypothetical protein